MFVSVKKDPDFIDYKWNLIHTGVYSSFIDIKSKTKQIEKICTKLAKTRTDLCVL